MHYTKAVDLWSVGCIVAEMFTHRALFPGSDRKHLFFERESIDWFKHFLYLDVNQLNRILDVAGFPSEKLLSQVNEDARAYLERIANRPRRQNFTEYFREIQSADGSLHYLFCRFRLWHKQNIECFRFCLAVSLIDNMLQLDPSDRLTCETALEHPYLSTFHDVEDEPTAEPFDDNYEAQEYPVHDWRDRIFQEIKSFEPPTEVDF
jgi:serine/threonine protein kinase